MERLELKMAAKDQIKGNIGMYFVCMLIVSCISGALGYIPKVGFILSFIFLSPMILAFARINLGMTNGEKVQVKSLLESFDDFGKALLLNILASVFICLWSILLVVPGIIKALSYSMSFYILAENPDMDAMEALEESKKIMEGHKWEFFVLLLSFILWDILGCITWGLAYIYVAPYKNATIADYYNKIKNEVCIDGEQF